MSKKNVRRNDLLSEDDRWEVNNNEDIQIKKIVNDDLFYSMIKFSKSFDSKKLRGVLVSEIRKLFKFEKIKNDYHVFVVGIGNDSHTADAVGPKTLKHVKVNTFFESSGINYLGNRISTLEPGVLGETGIETGRIIESVVSEIKPDFVFIIDSIVTDNINNLNKVIELTNRGITPGSGIKINSLEISKKSLKIPVIVLGVVTAVEIIQNKSIYYLSSSDIDKYVCEISRVIGETLNEIFLNF